MSACPNEPICAALYVAGLALSASHNLHVTDRPDLPREQWPVYVLDHDAELRAILRADRALRRAGSDCGRCRRVPTNEPTSFNSRMSRLLFGISPLRCLEEAAPRRHARSGVLRRLLRRILNPRSGPMDTS